MAPLSILSFPISVVSRNNKALSPLSLSPFPSLFALICGGAILARTVVTFGTPQYFTKVVVFFLSRHKIATKKGTIVSDFHSFVNFIIIFVQ